MNVYPRSFLRLILLGNVLVILPLLAAIGYASLAVDDITRRSQEAVSQASRAAALGHTLLLQFSQMERILRQYEVLRDAALLDEYRSLRQEWQRSSAEYSAIPMLADLAPRVGAIRDSEAAAYDGMGASGERLAQMKKVLIALSDGMHPIIADANRLVEREQDDFRLRAQALWQRLAAALLLALALTALLLWQGRRMVARLWSQFENAVLLLGQGRLEQRIRLRGPADMRRVGGRLDWLRRRLLALENERTRILRHASHELKTPLATLREGASLLREGIAGPLTPQQAKIAGIMQTDALRLQALIDGLLRMQQAAYARDQMETGRVRLDKLIEQTLAALQLSARNRHLRITGSLAPLSVEGNSEALLTLANNLIANAIKFSPDGGTVSITLAREDASACIDVADDGPGISSEEQGRLFEPFFRGKAGRGVPGVGLGLAIAHEFALAHRGSLEIVASERGAHFRARLPLAGEPA